jgi:ribonuclease J
MLMMSLTKPKNVLPIGGNYRHMVAYKDLARKLGFMDENIILLDNGQEVVFTKERAYLGRKLQLKNVYVDQTSGEEVDSFVLIDRQKIAKEGIVVVIAEVDGATGRLVEKPNIIVRGLTPAEGAELSKSLVNEIQKALSMNVQPVANWIHVRKTIGTISEKYIHKNLRKHPLVLPVVIEV